MIDPFDPLRTKRRIGKGQATLFSLLSSSKDEDNIININISIFEYQSLSAGVIYTHDISLFI